jgi:hypothetical protein
MRVSAEICHEKSRIEVDGKRKRKKEKKRKREKEKKSPVSLLAYLRHVLKREKEKKRKREKEKKRKREKEKKIICPYHLIQNTFLSKT